MRRLLLAVVVISLTVGFANAQTWKTCDCAFHGDLTGDGSYNAMDLSSLVDYLFAGGATPAVDANCPHINRSDLNCDLTVDALDLTYMVELLFNGGAAPCNPCPEIADAWGNGPLTIGPIDGLTTIWHPAPGAAAIPVGTQLQLRKEAPSDAQITWIGAAETERDETGSTAECLLDELGAQSIRVQVLSPARQGTETRILLDVVDLSVDDIQISWITASVDPLGIGETASNEETMELFFPPNSIAGLRKLSKHRYATSVDRRLDMNVTVNPPVFSPLTEWRKNGQAFGLGESASRTFSTAGLHTISVGPPDNEQQIEVETYTVVITSHVSDRDIVAEGEPITFEAATIPSGYEVDITWMSSTKFGSATPVLGRGPTFTVQFDNTFGSTQWLGVKADNVTFNQDQKLDDFARELEGQGGFGDILDHWRVDDGSSVSVLWTFDTSQRTSIPPEIEVPAAGSYAWYTGSSADITHPDAVELPGRGWKLELGPAPKEFLRAKEDNVEVAGKKTGLYAYWYKTVNGAGPPTDNLEPGTFVEEERYIAPSVTRPGWTYVSVCFMNNTECSDATVTICVPAGVGAVQLSDVVMWASCEQ